jgi:hypothetical protein
MQCRNVWCSLLDEKKGEVELLLGMERFGPPEKAPQDCIMPGEKGIMLQGWRSGGRRLTVFGGIFEEAGWQYVGTVVSVKMDGYLAPRCFAPGVVF